MIDSYTFCKSLQQLHAAAQKKEQSLKKRPMNHVNTSDRDDGLFASYPLKDLMFKPCSRTAATDILKLQDHCEYLEKLYEPAVPYEALWKAIPTRFASGPYCNMYEGTLAERISSAWLYIDIKKEMPDFSGCILERTDKTDCPGFKYQWKWKKILCEAVTELLRGKSFCVEYQDMYKKNSKVRLMADIRTDGPVLTISFP